MASPDNADPREPSLDDAANRFRQRPLAPRLAAMLAQELGEEWLKELHGFPGQAQQFIETQSSEGVRTSCRSSIVTR
jgi:hypothetical protein